MVLRKAMPMDDAHEAAQSLERTSATPPTLAANGQVRPDESASLSPGAPSASDSQTPQQAEMHHTGSSTHNVENPWAEESIATPRNGRPDYEPQPGASDYDFNRGNNIQHGHTPLMSPGIQNGEPFTPPTIQQNQPSLTHDQTGSGPAAAYPGKLQSNNPFLKAAQQNTGQQHEESRGQNEYTLNDNGPSNGQFHNPGGDNLTHLAHGLSLADDQTQQNVPLSSQASASIPYNTETTSWPPSTFDTTNSQSKGSYAVPPHQVFDYPRPLGEQRHVPERQRTESHPSVPLVNVEPATPSSSRDLLELDQNYASNAQPKEEQFPTEPEAPLPKDSERPNDIVADGQQPHPPLNNVEDHPSGSDLSTPGPVRPSPPSEAELARAREKRSETYDIRHINWTDRSGLLRESPVLVQNKNGPCPLLALVNGLVIRAAPNTNPPIVRALQTREKISLGLLTEALFDELTSCHRPEDQLPDIEALSSFLLMLHTGMNVNPKLTTDHDTPGKFLETSDIKLYSTFKLSLIHGWLASPTTAVHAALCRVAEYHEDIQLLQFRKEEMEDRVFRGGNLTQDEQQTVGDIDTIQYYVDVENATQLSAFGLDHLERTLEPGSVSILFRNDHFATLYKHPDSGQLFTLVTDAGYASHAEIVWESLVDVNGSNAELFSGDFRPVGHAPSSSRRQPPTVPQDGRRSEQNSSAAESAPKLPQDEQADADYAYALSLQFQDEEAQREQTRNNNRRGGARHSSGPSHTSAPSGSSTHNRSSTSVAHRNQSSISSRSGGRRSSRQTQEVHSLIPPRVASADQGTTTPTTPSNTTTRPTEETADAPPPTYEQAALSPVYKPPPDHPQYDGSPDVSPERPSTSTNPSVGFDRILSDSPSRNSQNRSAGFNPASSQSPSRNSQNPSTGFDEILSNSPGRNSQTHTPIYPAMGRRPPGATAGPAGADRYRERDRNKDCIVM
ncbi:hypothetical protein FQN54_009880 [Arachnomyces sp. PD_36]|nr:hypothetical protein FQN54_009880 [Arachnomyces sp. PD_36]